MPGCRLSALWALPSGSDESASLAAALGITTPAAKVLCHRGLADPQAAGRFLRPSLDDLLDPLTLRDMPRAVERLREAIRGGEKILIYGDYDVDGTTSVVLLTKAIELAGGAAEFHVPHRLKDGYGMRPEVVGARRGRGRAANRQRGYRNSRRRSGAPRQRTGHRRNRHRSSPARGRITAGAGGAQSQPVRLPVCREEPVRRGSGFQTGARPAGHARPAAREAPARGANR